MIKDMYRKRRTGIVPAFALMLCLLMMLFSTNVYAASASLTLSYTSDDAGIPDGAFSVYRVADVTVSGKTYSYTPVPEFSEYPSAEESMTAQKWTQLAKTLAGYVQEDAVEPLDTGVTRSDGILTFPNVTRDGLYLVTGKSHTVNGWTYTPAPFMVVLTGGSIQSEVKYEKEQVPENKPEALYIDPPVEKVIQGREVPEETFTFRMTGVGSAPMPERANGQTATATVTGAGKVEFGKITFDDPGIYVYTISETKGSTPGFIYDDTIFTMTVEVTLKDGKLSSNLWFVRNKEAGILQTARFVNAYEKPGAPASPGNPPGSSQSTGTPKTGDSMNLMFWGLAAIGSLFCLILILAFMAREKRRESSGK